jgi:hypothetical protein
MPSAAGTRRQAGFLPWAIERTVGKRKDQLVNLQMSRLLRAVLGAWLLAAAFGSALWWSIPQAEAQTGSAQYTVYLPLLRRSGAPTEPPPPPPPPASGGFFFADTVKHNNAAIVIDGRGGMHAAYTYFTPDAEHPPAVYAYCPGPASACAEPAAWSRVALADLVDEVQLALTPAGRPRLLIVGAESGTGGSVHQYAACDANCTSAAAWSLTPIVTTYNADEILANDLPQRSFAISPQGTVAFVANNRDYAHSEPDKYGAYYHACAANCSDADNWSATPLSKIYRDTWRFDYEVFKFPVLKFTADGEPRLLARVFALNDDGSAAENGIYYYGCAAACADATNWQRTFLIPSGDGAVPHPSWDLALASGAQPRIALFTGAGLEPAEYNHNLLYLYCETNCFDREQWGFHRVGVQAGSGLGADLELSAAGTPRIAWIDSVGELGYAWCDAACESDAPGWQQRIVETEAQLRAAHPQAIPPTCDGDVWSGLAPHLALDAAGNPLIAYDVAVEARCLYDDTPGDPTDPPQYRFEPIWRGARLSFFAQP